MISLLIYIRRYDVFYHYRRRQVAFRAADRRCRDIAPTRNWRAAAGWKTGVSFI